MQRVMRPPSSWKSKQLQPSRSRVIPTCIRFLPRHDGCVPRMPQVPAAVTPVFSHLNPTWKGGWQEVAGLRAGSAFSVGTEALLAQRGAQDSLGGTDPAHTTSKGPCASFPGQRLATAQGVGTVQADFQLLEVSRRGER